MASARQLWMRRKLGALLGAVIAAGSLVAVALAGDVVTADGDLVDVNAANPVNLGTVAPGASISKTVRFTLTCNSKQHVDQGETVTLTYESDNSQIPSDGGLTVTNGSVGPIPASWAPDTTGSGQSNCDTTPQTLTSTAGTDSSVEITAPSDPGSYTFVVFYRFGGTSVDLNDVQGSNVQVTYNLVVAAPSNRAPTADAGGPYSGSEGANVSLSGASASDQDSSDTLTYAWTAQEDPAFNDVDDGASCSFSNALTLNPTVSCTDDGHWLLTLSVDDGHVSSPTTDTASLVLSNANPTATAGFPAGNVNEGSSFTLSLTNPQDAGSNDTTFTYRFDCGDGLGYSAADAANSASCPTTDNGSRSVKAKILDDDGGSSEYTATVQVVNVPPAFASGSPAFASPQVSCAAAGNVTLNYSFTDPGADTWTAFIDWNYNGTTFSPDPVAGQSITNKTGSFTHAYSSAGVHTAAIKIVDDDGGETGLGTAPLTVLFNTSGILQPINDTRNGQPVSLFKFKSTVPVKVQIQDCDGSYPSSLAPTVAIWLSSSSPPPTGMDEVASTVPPTSGNTMRFTGAPDNQYIYNLATKNLSDSSATYNIRVTIPQTGQTLNATLGLKP